MAGDETQSETDGGDHDLAVAATEVSDGSNTAERTRDPGDLVGKKVERYQVLARLGAGGMGVVYAAHDPALDRKIALKVLPPLDRDRQSHLEGRLRREAQALARLDHPNVIGVYDVGVAEHSVFIAMQLVDGDTLADHLAARRLPPREILALFLAAGRGLAAAHAAGIVHRDVKPGNVLVDRNGGVFVGDFGLARGAADDEPAAEVSASLLDESLTRVGAVVGTPLYMAPEQHRGEPATAASDQFSFCVSLWQALFDQHPFHHGPWVSATVLAAMAQDRVREPASTRGVSPRVIRALRRGLRHDPAARWPSMDALLQALTPRTRAGLVWGGLAIAGIAGAVALTAAITGGAPDRGAACRRGAARVDAVWPTRAQPLREALLASAAPEASRMAERVDEVLTAYTTKLRALRLDTCEVDAHGDVTPALRDLQLRCLDDDLAVTGALIDELAAGDAKLHAHAIDSVAALPALEDCSSRALAGLPPPPASGLVEVSRITEVLGRVLTIIESDQLDAAMTLVTTALADAEALGYQPLIAQALYAKARVLEASDQPGGMEAATRAAELATSARADRVASAAYTLALLIAANEPDLAQVETLTPVARAVARRTEDPKLNAMFAYAAGAGATARADYDEAIALCTEAEAYYAQDPANASVTPLSCLVQANLYKGDVDAAARWAEASLARYERQYGRSSWSMELPLRQLAAVRRRQGKLDDAIALYQEALQLDERGYGADSGAVGTGLVQLAQLMHQTHRVDEGLALIERGAAIVAKTESKPGASTMNANVTYAQLLRAAGRREEMYARYATALEIGERVLAADDVNLASLRFSYGGALAEDSRYDEALALLRQSGDALARIGSPRAVIVQAAEAEILQAQERYGEAVPMFEAVVASLTASGADPANLALTQLNLAKSLWDGRIDRPRARALVGEVEAAAKAMGDPALAEECATWLKSHR